MALHFGFIIICYVLNLSFLKGVTSVAVSEEILYAQSSLTAALNLLIMLIFLKCLYS